MPTDARQQSELLARIEAQRDEALRLLEAANARAKEWEQRYWKVTRDYSDLVGELTMEGLAGI